MKTLKAYLHSGGFARLGESPGETGANKPRRGATVSNLLAKTRIPACAGMTTFGLSCLLAICLLAIGISAPALAADIPLPPSPGKFLEPLENLLEGAPKAILPPPPGIKLVPLPPIILVPGRAVYRHGDYHYYYWGGLWYFSPGPDGPWHKLPKSFYPKKYKKSGPKGPKGVPPGHMPKERGKGRGK